MNEASRQTSRQRLVNKRRSMGAGSWHATGTIISRFRIKCPPTGRDHGVVPIHNRQAGVYVLLILFKNKILLLGPCPI